MDEWGIKASALRRQGHRQHGLGVGGIMLHALLAKSGGQLVGTAGVCLVRIHIPAVPLAQYAQHCHGICEFYHGSAHCIFMQILLVVCLFALHHMYHAAQPCSEHMLPYTALQVASDADVLIFCPPHQHMQSITRRLMGKVGVKAR